jgi:hypothetical protein
MTLLWIIPVVSIIILLWMIVLEMGFIDVEELFGVNIDQWFMLSVFIIILCIIILILSVVGTLLGEGIPAEGKAAKRTSESNRAVVIEAVPEEAESKPTESSALNNLSEGEIEAQTITEEEVVEAISKEEEISEGLAAPEGPGEKITEYPAKVTGGLYGDTYIKIDKARILKLRTVIIEDHYLY